LNLVKGILNLVKGIRNFINRVMEFFLVFFTTCSRSYIMYKFCDVYYSMNIPDSFMQCVFCCKKCGDFHQAAVYVANILTFSIGTVLPTSQSSWEHKCCSWMQFTIKCPQFEDKEEEVYEDLCYVTFSSSPPEVQGFHKFELLDFIFACLYFILCCI